MLDYLTKTSTLGTIQLIKGDISDCGGHYSRGEEANYPISGDGPFGANDERRCSPQQVLATKHIRKAPLDMISLYEETLFSTNGPYFSSYMTPMIMLVETDFCLVE